MYIYIYISGIGRKRRGNHWKIWYFSSSSSSSLPLPSQQFPRPACSIIPGEDATQASISPWNGKKCQAIGTHCMYSQRIQVFWAWTHPHLLWLGNAWAQQAQAHPKIYSSDDFRWMVFNKNSPGMRWNAIEPAQQQQRCSYCFFFVGFFGAEICHAAKL